MFITLQNKQTQFVFCTNENIKSDVYWTVHHCDNWRIKNKLDATCCFIVLLIDSTCFGHYYDHHQLGWSSVRAAARTLLQPNRT